MDTKLTYYEGIAIDVCKVEEQDLRLDFVFKKTRKREVVLARQFCMYYRKYVLGLSLGSAGNKYGRDHATVLHAKKTINNLKDTKDEDALKFYEFERRCMKVFDKEDKIAKIRRQMLHIHNNVQTHGFRELISSAARDFLSAFSVLDAYLNGDDDLEQEMKIRESMATAFDSAKGLIELFSYEDIRDMGSDEGD